MSAAPVYPSWIRSARIRTFWALTAGIVLLAVGVDVFGLPGLAISVLALPFLYVALVITMTSYRLSPRGDDLQAAILLLLGERAGSDGPLLDVGCGSGQLLIHLAKASPGEYIGVDAWPHEWGDFSKHLAENNANLEGVPSIEFAHGTASRLPFPDERFGRVVSSMTFHEVRDTTDKTDSLVEALRVLQPGGRFAFIDRFYVSREQVLEVIRTCSGRIESARALSDLVQLPWPMNTATVLGHAVVVWGTKRRHSKE